MKKRIKRRSSPRAESEKTPTEETPIDTVQAMEQQAYLDALADDEMVEAVAYGVTIFVKKKNIFSLAQIVQEFERDHAQGEMPEIIKRLSTSSILPNLLEMTTAAQDMRRQGRSQGELDAHGNRKEYISRRDAAILERKAVPRTDGEIVNDLKAEYRDITLAIVKATLRRKR